MQPSLTTCIPPTSIPNSALHHSVDIERHAFEALLTTYQGAVFGYLYHMLGDADVAEDAAQETFLRAYGACHRTVTHPNPRALLFHIAANIARDELRHQQRIRWLPWDGTLRATEHRRPRTRGSGRRAPVFSITRL